MEEMLLRIESAMGVSPYVCPVAPALGSFVWACFEAPVRREGGRLGQTFYRPTGKSFQCKSQLGVIFRELSGCAGMGNMPNAGAGLRSN
jgi:hypothetical protein